jgi:hypothetical protein
VTVRMIGGTGEDIQFERGGVKTPVEQRPPQIELALCQRDYAKSYAIGTSPGAGVGPGRYWIAGNVGSSIAGKINFPVPMRSAPSITLWDGNGISGNTVSFSAGGIQTVRAAAASAITDAGFEVGAAVGSDVVITGQWTAATGF